MRAVFTVACLLLLAVSCDAAVAKASASSSATVIVKGGNPGKGIRKVMVRSYIRCGRGGAICCWRYTVCGTVIRRRAVRKRSPKCMPCTKRCSIIPRKTWKKYVMCWRGCYKPCRTFVTAQSKFMYRFIRLCPTTKVHGNCAKPAPIISKYGRRVKPKKMWSNARLKHPPHWKHFTLSVA